MGMISLKNKSAAFLDELDNWMASLSPASFEEIFANINQTALVSVDVVNGFCVEGILASNRVAGIVDPIVKLMESYWQRGGRQIIHLHDSHDPQAVEFGAFPPHCVRGTKEAETVQQIQELPFFDQIQIFPKNSISSGLNPLFDCWLAEHAEIRNFIVVGDCTDLCTYQLAMHLRLQANTYQMQRRVIIPANCVDTYDMPVETAHQIGSLAHDADLFHAVFLYHMFMNGIEVFSRING